MVAFQEPDSHFRLGKSFDQSPKTSAMVGFDQVGQFVDDHVVNYISRQFEKFVAESDAPAVGGAAAPTLLLIGHPIDGKLELASEISAVESLGSSHKRGFRAADGFLAALEARSHAFHPVLLLGAGEACRQTNHQHPLLQGGADGLAPFSAAYDADFQIGYFRLLSTGATDGSLAR